MKLQKFVGQTLAQLSIGGVITIMIVASVIGALLATNVVTDLAIIALIGLITLIVTVVVIMQIVSKM